MDNDPFDVWYENLRKTRRVFSLIGKGLFWLGIAIMVVSVFLMIWEPAWMNLMKIILIIGGLVLVAGVSVIG